MLQNYNHELYPRLHRATHILPHSPVFRNTTGVFFAWLILCSCVWESLGVSCLLFSARRCEKVTVLLPPKYSLSLKLLRMWKTGSHEVFEICFYSCEKCIKKLRDSTVREDWILTILHSESRFVVSTNNLNTGGSSVWLFEATQCHAYTYSKNKRYFQLPLTTSVDNMASK